MKTEIRKILADKTETLEDGRVVIVPDFSQLDDLVDDLDTLFSLHVVSNHVVCDGCGDTGRGEPTLQEPDGADCEKCSSK